MAWRGQPLSIKVGKFFLIPLVGMSIGLGYYLITLLGALFLTVVVVGVVGLLYVTLVLPSTQSLGLMLLGYSAVVGTGIWTVKRTVKRRRHRRWARHLMAHGISAPGVVVSVEGSRGEVQFRVTEGEEHRATAQGLRSRLRDCVEDQRELRVLYDPCHREHVCVPELLRVKLHEPPKPGDNNRRQFQNASRQITRLQSGTRLDISLHSLHRPTPQPPDGPRCTPERLLLEEQLLIWTPRDEEAISISLTEPFNVTLGCWPWSGETWALAVRIAALSKPTQAIAFQVRVKGRSISREIPRQQAVEPWMSERNFEALWKTLCAHHQLHESHSRLADRVRV